MENGKRINIYLNDTIIDKVDKGAEDIGISRSAFIAVLVSQHFKGQETVSTLSRACDALERGGVMNGKD